MDTSKSRRTDSSPYSPRHFGASHLYFSDTDFSNIPLAAAEMTESSVHVKYHIDEDILNVSHLKMSEARKRKIKWFPTHNHNRKKARFQPDRRLSDTTLPSPNIKTNQQTPDDKDIMKMGRARRRKYKWLIKHGYSKEEAIVRSKHPMSVVVKMGTKTHPKNIFEENLPEVERKKKPASNFSIQIGIFPAEFPEVRFQKEQFEALEESLNEHILKDTAYVPQFRGTICKNGWLLVTCASMSAVEWLKEVVPSLKPWKGAKLNVLEEKKFPKPMNLICFLPKSSTISNECILDFLRKQNPTNLDVSSWNILYREDSCDMTKAIIRIDDASALLLTKDGAKLYYMLGFANFMIVNAQSFKAENSPNLINGAGKFMKRAKREEIAGSSQYVFESTSYSSKINDTSNYESSLERKNIGSTTKCNEYRIPNSKERVEERDPYHSTSNQNYDSYLSISVHRNEQEIGLLEDQLRHERRDLELELERKSSQPYLQRRSRSPKRYYEMDYGDRDREGNRIGSSSLTSFYKR